MWLAVRYWKSLCSLRFSWNPFRAERDKVVAVEYKCVIQLHDRMEDALLPSARKPPR
jgi:hypothetical protein